MGTFPSSRSCCCHSSCSGRALMGGCSWMLAYRVARYLCSGERLSWLRKVVVLRGIGVRSQKVRGFRRFTTSSASEDTDVGAASSSGWVRKSEEGKKNGRPEGAVYISRKMCFVRIYMHGHSPKTAFAHGYFMHTSTPHIFSICTLVRRLHCAVKSSLVPRRRGSADE